MKENLLLLKDLLTLRKTIYKYMTSMSKNLDIDNFDEIVNKCNIACHTRIKIKPVDINPSMYIDFNKENNDQDSEFKIGNIVRISKCKNIFAKALFHILLNKFL